MTNLLVACLGGGVSGDQAAGSAVHGLLSACALPEGARLALVPPRPQALLAALGRDAALLVVGEVELGARPGAVHVLDWTEVPIGGDGGTRSGHCLRFAMEGVLIQEPARAPRQALLVGIEGRSFGAREGGMHLDVAASLAGAARLVLDLSGRLVDAGGVAPTVVIPPGLRASSTPPPRPVAGR